MISELNLSALPESAQVALEPFLKAVLDNQTDAIQAIYATGSVVTKDYQHNRSDINSLIILNSFSQSYLELLAPLGKKYGKKHVAAPLLMTKEYITRSLDCYPIELLNIVKKNSILYGEEILADISVEHKDLRLQCERELKGRLVNLRQGFIQCMAKEDKVAHLLLDILSSLIPVFCGLLYLKDKEIPELKTEIISGVSEAFSLDCSSAHTLLSIRKKQVRWEKGAALKTFSDFYNLLDRISNTVDQMD